MVRTCRASIHHQAESFEEKPVAEKSQEKIIEAIIPGERRSLQEVQEGRL